MCESSAAALAALAGAAAKRSDAAEEKKPYYSMFYGLEKMKAHAAQAALEGRHIPSNAEMGAAERQNPTRRRRPGRPPKEKAIDLTGSAAAVSKLQAKRKAAAEGAKKASKALKTKKYARWTDDDKKVALQAVALVNGNKADALR
jgi:hypothetical protein